MSMKQIRAALLGMCMAMLAPASHAQVQYSTDWLANTYGTLASTSAMPRARCGSRPRA